jgi:hypothetical protein
MVIEVILALCQEKNKKLHNHLVTEPFCLFASMYCNVVENCNTDVGFLFIPQLPKPSKKADQTNHFICIAQSLH